MFNTPIGDWRSTPADKRQKRISMFGDIDDVFSLRGQGIGTGGTQSIT